MPIDPLAARRFAGWAALIGAVCAFANVALVASMSGSDQGMVLHGETMLSLAPALRQRFEAGMAADIFGFYLPFVAIGGFLWHRSRATLGAWADMALLAIAMYIALGIVGAALDMAALEPLAHLHAGGDAAARGAASAVWTGIAGAVQDGLWLFEGPLMVFWALLTARHLKSTGDGYPVLLKVIGYVFGAMTLAGLIAGLGGLAGVLETVAVVLLPIWMALFGLQLLRTRPAATAPSGAGETI